MVDSVGDHGVRMSDGVAEDSCGLLVVLLGETGNFACLGLVRRLHDAECLV